MNILIIGNGAIAAKKIAESSEGTPWCALIHVQDMAPAPD